MYVLPYVLWYLIPDNKGGDEATDDGDGNELGEEKEEEEEYELEYEEEEDEGGGGEDAEDDEMANDENDDEMVIGLLDTPPTLEFKRIYHMVLFTHLLSNRQLESKARLTSEAE